MRAKARQCKRAMSKLDTRIVIVGGGMAGLSLAAALSRHGVPWILLERAQTLAPIGASIALMPPALRVGERLGLLKELQQASLSLLSQRRHKADGELVVEVSYRGVWGGAECRAILRADLQRILLSAATGGEILLGRNVNGIRASGTGAVVEFDGGSVSGALVVGADGVRSTMRRLTGGVEARPLGQRIYRAHTPAGGLVATHTLFLGRAVLSAVPLGVGTYLSCLENTEEGQAGPIEGRRNRIRGLLRHLTAPLALRLLEAWPEDALIHEDTTWEVPVDDRSWRSGRVILLGDAAHAMAQVLGVGGAMALEDAWVLAEEITGKSDYDGALDAYVARRVPRVRWVQERSAEWVRRIRTGTAPRDLVADFTAAYEPLLDEP